MGKVYILPLTLFIVGVIGAVLLGVGAGLFTNGAYEWNEGSCKVIEKEIQHKRGTRYRAAFSVDIYESENSTDTIHNERMAISGRFDGSGYQDTESEANDTLKLYSVGKRYACWHSGSPYSYLSTYKAINVVYFEFSESEYSMV